MSNSAAYWREVRTRAWDLSKEHFAWSYPIIAGAVLFALQAWSGGWTKAMEDLTAGLLSAGATVIIAVTIYAVNLFRAASARDVEQMQNIVRIEREKDKVAKELRDTQALTRNQLSAADHAAVPVVAIEVAKPQWEDGVRAFSRVSMAMVGITATDRLIVPKVSITSRSNGVVAMSIRVQVKTSKREVFGSPEAPSPETIDSIFLWLTHPIRLALNGEGVEGRLVFEVPSLSNDEKVESYALVFKDRMSEPPREVTVSAPGHFSGEIPVRPL